jgi:signal transduction histidine kinase
VSSYKSFNYLVYKAIPSVALGLALAYLGLTIIYLFRPPVAAAPFLITLAAITAALLLILHRLLARKPMPNQYAHPIASGIAGLVLLNAFLHLFLTQTLEHKYSLIFLILGASFFLLSRRWLTAVYSITIILWVILFLLYRATLDFSVANIELIVTFIIAVAFHFTYTQTLMKYEKLRLQEEDRSRELAKALVAVEQAHKMQDDLTHTMVHDLRNPLAIIYTTTQQLDSAIGHNMSTQHREFLYMAYKSAEKSLQLVNDILAINRLETGRMPIQPYPFRLPDLVKDVLNTQAILAHEKSIELSSRFHENLPFVYADAHLIERVLQNLVGNAIKFTPDGGKVSIMARQEHNAQQQRMLVSINDTGMGIPTEIQGRLFDKFTTGGQEERGSGLGLAFCKMVLEAHGENIWVANSSEKGTTFSFTLPLASMMN